MASLAPSLLQCSGFVVGTQLNLSSETDLDALRADCRSLVAVMLHACAGVRRIAKQYLL